MGRRSGREFVPGAYNFKRRKGQGRRKYAKRLRKGPEDALRCNGDEFAVGKDTRQAEKIRNRDGDTSSTPQTCKCVICRTVKPAARRRDKNVVEFAERVERYALFGSWMAKADGTNVAVFKKIDGLGVMRRHFRDRDRKVYFLSVELAGHAPNIRGDN